MLEAEAYQRSLEIKKLSFTNNIVLMCTGASSKSHDELWNFCCYLLLLIAWYIVGVNPLE